MHIVSNEANVHQIQFWWLEVEVWAAFQQLSQPFRGSKPVLLREEHVKHGSRQHNRHMASTFQDVEED